MLGRKDIALFNGMFYLWLYGIGYMVKDHLNSKRGNLFYIFLIPHRIAPTTAFVTPIMEHWLE